jgi:uncharacterized membrane protein
MQVKKKKENKAWKVEKNLLNKIEIAEGLWRENLYNTFLLRGGCIS